MELKQMGKRMRFARQMAELTQEQLAQKIGVSASYLGLIERGARRMNVEMLYDICVQLSVSADVLLGLKEMELEW